MILQILSSFSAIFFMILCNNIIKKKWQKLPPGPIGLPILGHLHLLGPLIHQSFHKLSSQFGPLMYLKLGSVSCIVVSTPELAKQVLKTHELTFSSRKHSFAIDVLTYNSSFAFSPYGPYWKFIKKISTFELLGSRMLNHFQPVRTKELHSFLAKFYAKSKNGESVNVTEELMKLSNNIISVMMLSMRSSDSDNEAETARSVVRQVTQVFGEFNVSDLIWLCKKVDLKGFKNRVYSIKREYDRLLEKVITEREEMRKKKKNKNEEYEAKDFLDIMLDVMEDQSAEIQLTRNHIKALFLDLFTAATDTTAITLEWAIAELINHPSILQKARQEINTVVGNGSRIVNESDISKLVHIQAILKETFRLHPPIPMLSRKSIQDCTINGYKIPANSMLFVNIWAFGRDPKNWENPLDFEPERFLIGDQNRLIDVKGQNFELLPFGSGRRSCPGISFAMQQLPTTLAAMIQCFDFMIDDHVLDMTERPGLTAPRILDLVCVPFPVSSHLLDPLL